MRYEKAIIPEGKNPLEYTYIERRAEILKLIIKAGSPKNLSRTQLAERYGVSISQISQDFKTVAKEFEKIIGKDAKYRTSIFYEKVIDIASKAKTIREAVESTKIVTSWNDWLFDIGKQKKVAEKLILEDGPKRRSMGEIYEKILAEKELKKKSK